MNSSTQKKIAKHVYKAWQGLAKPLGRETLKHREGIEILRIWFGPQGLPFSLILANPVMGNIPDEARRVASAFSAEQFEIELALLDTEEKFEAWLLSLPEPSPEQLEFFLKLIDTLVLQFGNALNQKLIEFPRDPGGHPRRFSLKKEHEIKKEIKRMHEAGVSLTKIFDGLSERYGVSKTKIKRIWYDPESA